MNKMKCLYFGGGFLAGAAVVGIAEGLYFRKKFREIVKELTENVSAELADKYIRKDDEEKELQEDLVEIANSRAKVTRADIPGQSEESHTDYRGMYKYENDEFEDGKKLAEELEEEEKEETPEEEADNWHDKNKDRKPEIMSLEATGELPPFVDGCTLFIYTDNEIVTDEDGVVMEDYERLLGDCLEESQFIYTDDQQMFVMNYELDTLYDIQKVWGAYEG